MWFRRLFRRPETTTEAMDPKFRCCGCCHVKTGTICLGMYNMILETFGIFVLLCAVMNPSVLMNGWNDLSDDNAGIFDVKQTMADRNANVQLTPANIGEVSEKPVELETDETVGSMDQMKSVLVDRPTSTVSNNGAAFLKPDVLGFAKKRAEAGDAELALALLLGLFFITALMVYGAIKGRPSYLLPFFCFQVFDFVLACLTAAGHYAWLPNVQEIIQEHPEIPFREQLMKLDGQWIALGVLMAYVIVLIAKAYFIGVVWSCYQYLRLRQNSVVTYTTAEDGQRCTPELLLPPNYDDAVKMPPAYPATGEAPPPPYPPSGPA